MIEELKKENSGLLFEVERLKRQIEHLTYTENKAHQKLMNCEQEYRRLTNQLSEVQILYTDLLNVAGG